ncbi:MAG: ATP-binding protein [Deltaproteobacteria bacterium]|nr:ATP-binding protein [Deltaproteobacteria bacterium]
MTDSSVSFKLKNNLSELKALFKNMEMFCIQLGLSNRCKCEMDLVLEELFTNITSYGYTDEDEHWIEITISLKDNRIIMRIEDDGIPFNPLEFEAPDIDGPLDERGIGGLGVHLTKHFTEDIVYERRGNKNILTLRKIVPE